METRRPVGWLAVFSFSAVLAGCGGGGDDGDPPPATAPTVSLSANPTNVAAGGNSTLTWTSTNATSCTASDGWSGTKSTSGNEAVGPLAVTTTFALSCTGPGGSTSQTTTVTVASAGDVIVSGTITFERPQFRASGQGLNMDDPIIAPAREVIVEAINPNTRARIGSATVTDTNGEYSLSVPQNTQVIVSARAEMVKTTAPTWNFKVLNNTNSNALYVLDSAAFNTGTANVARDLRATTGWGGTSYTGTRAAAPFAILDTVYEARELVRSADATTSFAPLNLYWSDQNRPANGCTTDGNIGTSFYTSGSPAGDGCQAVPEGIYILGEYVSNGDTDEFDGHVIAHEFGHYFEDKFSRSDSIGGSHTSGDLLDLRVAFGEGFGNAYAGMVLDDPEYRDSRDGISTDFTIDLESEFPSPQGWYSEFSIGEILWDLYDPANDGSDQIQMGFAPIYAVLTGEQRTTPALTSIFSFSDALRSENSASIAGINALLSDEMISTNSDAFGNNEITNDGGIDEALPIYQPITMNAGPVVLCASNGDLSRNKLGYRRFLTLSLAANSLLVVTVTSQGANGDPDIVVHTRGDRFVSQEVGLTETTDQRPFAAGTHIIEVYDYNATNGAPSCMSVSVTGSPQ